MKSIRVQDLIVTLGMLPMTGKKIALTDTESVTLDLLGIKKSNWALENMSLLIRAKDLVLSIELRSGSRIVSIPQESFLYSDNNTVTEHTYTHGGACCTVWTPFTSLKGIPATTDKVVATIEVRDHIMVLVDDHGNRWVRSHITG